MCEKQAFNELTFFSELKKRPGMYLGSPSLLSLRDNLYGMDYAFSFCSEDSPLRYFRAFIDWYHTGVLDDANGYACWWNHLLYTSGNDDRIAFKRFFDEFERFLRDVYNVNLPSEKS